MERIVEEVAISSGTPVTIADISIDGMSCEMMCGGSIKKALAKLPGVAGTEIDFIEGDERDHAIVTYDESKVTDAEMVRGHPGAARRPVQGAGRQDHQAGARCERHRRRSGRGQGAERTKRVCVSAPAAQIVVPGSSALLTTCSGSEQRHSMSLQRGLRVPFFIASGDARTFPHVALVLSQPQWNSQAEAHPLRWSHWLITGCVLIACMVVIGGITRLTGSGLSITEWKPIMGALPPMNEAEWNEAFAKYKQIPEYTLKNPDMDLAGFKRHLLLGIPAPQLGPPDGPGLLHPLRRLSAGRAC